MTKLATPDAPNGARHGSDVLERLRQRPPALWYRGEPVRDVTAHPALARGAATLAELYDLQWQHREVCLFDSPTSGRKVGRSFQMPRTHDELLTSGGAFAKLYAAQFTAGSSGG